MEAAYEVLQEAIEKRNSLEILKLLEIDLKPANKDECGNTVLHLILDNEKLPEKMVEKILVIFLDEGIDPNAENRRRETALHLAVARRMKDVIDLLIRYKATINADGRRFITHYFVEDEHEKFWRIRNNDEREIAEVQTATFVHWLISRGFDFNIRNDAEADARNAISAFDIAQEGYLLHVITTVLENIVKDLDFDGSNINYKKRILFVDYVFFDAWKCLENAAEASWYKEYRLRHATSIVRILLEATGPTDRERSPLLDLALSSGEPTVVEMVTNDFPAGCDERSLATTMFHRVMRKLRVFRPSTAQTKVMRDLISRGADVNGRDANGTTPLYWPVHLSYARVVEFLRDNGADFHVLDRQSNGNLLHVVTTRAKGQCGFFTEAADVLDLLVDQGVEIDATNVKGHTPLQIAARDRNWMLVRGLVFHGAKVDGILGDGRKCCDRCLREIGVLKDTFVDGRTSLYRMLHTVRFRGE